MAKALATVGKIAGLLSVIPGPQQPILAAVAAVATPAAAFSTHAPRRPMTAINMFVGEKHVYVAHDGALVDVAKGTMHSHTVKALMFEEVGMLFAVSGKIGVTDLFEAMNKKHSLVFAPTQQTMLAAALDGLREIRRTMVRIPSLERTKSGGVAVFAAFYDRLERRPRILLAMSDSFPNGAYEPFKWHEEAAIIMPGLSPDQLEIAWPNDETNFPRRELAAMLEQQRHVANPIVAGRCGVGGNCLFYRVGPMGIEWDELLRFPEQPGERLDPRRSGQRVPSPLDMALTH